MHTRYYVQKPYYYYDSQTPSRDLTSLGISRMLVHSYGVVMPVDV